jgi:hypothetical protein
MLAFWVVAIGVLRSTEGLHSRRLDRRFRRPIRIRLDPSPPAVQTSGTLTR